MKYLYPGKVKFSVVVENFTRELHRMIALSVCVFFFFQAEDGIRDRNVTGVQTCALPIFRVCGAEDTRPRQKQVSRVRYPPAKRARSKFRNQRRQQRPFRFSDRKPTVKSQKIGRASCRERVKNTEEDGEKKKKESERKRTR